MVACTEKDGDARAAWATWAKPGGVMGRLLAKAQTVPPPPSATLPDLDAILAMSCAEFAKADLVLMIRSLLLGDDIVLASDETAAARASREHAVFLAEEILDLYRTGSLDVDALTVLHRVKRGLPSARLESVDRGAPNWGVRQP